MKITVDTFLKRFQLWKPNQATLAAAFIFATGSVK
jgi:hypothetical protein